VDLDHVELIASRVLASPTRSSAVVGGPGTPGPASRLIHRSCGNCRTSGGSAASWPLPRLSRTAPTTTAD